MQGITSACLLAGALALSVLPVAARETESVGTSSDPLIVAPSQGSKPRDACKQGYVWREARKDDHVCVTPQTRKEVADQNRGAQRLWMNGAYGKHTCVQGYVWREAFKGDDVCVRPEVRERTRQDNKQAAQRRVGG